MKTPEKRVKNLEVRSVGSIQSEEEGEKKLRKKMKKDSEG